MKTERIRIDLTKEQQDHIKQESGHDVQSIELGVQELEERVAPLSLNFTKVEYTNVQVKA